MQNPDLYDEKFHLRNTAAARYRHRFIAESFVKAVTEAGVSLTSCLDIGSSTGAVLKEIGFLTGLAKENLYGIDYGSAAEKGFCSDKAVFINHDLTAGHILAATGGFPAVICQEVAERIPSEFESNVIQTISVNLAHGGILLWSAASKRQKGFMHVNLRRPGYWRYKLYCEGIVIDDILTEIYRGNMRSLASQEQKIHLPIYIDKTAVFRRQQEQPGK